MCFNVCGVTSSKFGHLDANSHANTSPGNLPSFKAMAKLAQTDPLVANEKYAHMDDMLDDFEDDRDVHRMAYGKRELEFPRQSVFGGTSNDDDYLSDPTSSRRFHVWRTPTSEFDPIDFSGLEEARDMIWGEAYQRYLDMREEQPHGDLKLDLSDPEVIRERNEIAEGSRKITVAEIIAEEVEAWLDTPSPACEVMVDADGLTLPGYEDDKTPMIRNLVTAIEAFSALRHEEALVAYGKTDSRSYGKALNTVPGWRSLGRVRKLGGKKQTVWYCRSDDEDSRWIPAPEQPDKDDEIDDLLG